MTNYRLSSDPLRISPPSLFDLCCSAGSVQDVDQYKKMSVWLKERILKTMTLKGVCGNLQFSALIYSHIEKLDLKLCSLSISSLLLIKNLNALKWLALPQPPHVNSRAYSEEVLLKVVGNKMELTYISLSGLHGVTDRVIKHLLASSSKTLKYLNVSHTRITDKMLVNLRRLHSLTKLDISGTKVTNYGIEALSTGSVMDSLHVIVLIDCKELTNNAFEALRSQSFPPLHWSSSRRLSTPLRLQDLDIFKSLPKDPGFCRNKKKAKPLISKRTRGLPFRPSRALTDHVTYQTFDKEIIESLTEIMSYYESLML